MGREHNGQLGSAAVRPISGGGLGVEVDHRRIAASPYGSHRQVQGNCRFPRSSFLADNGDGLHDTASWFAGLNVVDGGRSHRGTFASKTSIRCLGPVEEQKAVKRKRGELVPIGEVIADLPGQVQALQPSTPAQHHFTLADQVDRLVSASEADPEMGFMARMMALCSLPRTNPGNRKAYKRVNGPFTLSMVAGAGKLLPFGNLPRLLLAWLCSEVVRMGSREIVLGASLAEFMRKLGIYSTSGKKYRSLREQMKRLFGCTISLVYSDANCEDTAATLIADRTTFWWTKPEGAVSWQSKIHVSETFFNEIMGHPVPLNMNTLKALKRSSLGLDLYLWLTYRVFSLRGPQAITWRQMEQQFGKDPGRASDKFTVRNFRTDCLRELTKIKAAWPKLSYSTAPGVLILNPSPPQIESRG